MPLRSRTAVSHSRWQTCRKAPLHLPRTIPRWHFVNLLSSAIPDLRVRILGFCLARGDWSAMPQKSPPIPPLFKADNATLAFSATEDSGLPVRHPLHEKSKGWVCEKSGGGFVEFSGGSRGG